MLLASSTGAPPWCRGRAVESGEPSSLQGCCQRRGELLLSQVCECVVGKACRAKASTGSGWW
jgi:hypothetical protein